MRPPLVLFGRVPLACPRCRASLLEDSTQAACPACGAVYAMVDRIPVLTMLDDAGPGGEHKRRQIEFFDRGTAEFEITRPRGQPRLYQWLMQEKFARSVRDVEDLLPGATVLTVCGGSGMDAEFLARRGAAVIASDISRGAARRTAERASRGALPIAAVVADAERLPFADRSVDVVYVHDGLHHLSDPMVGLAEMCRVANRAVLVTEPARAAVTALAVRLGIALDREDAGNRVERVTPRQLSSALAQQGFEVVGVDRYAMYYQHEPRWAMHLLSRRRAFTASRLAIVGFNHVLGSIGNKLSVRAVRAGT